MGLYIARTFKDYEEILQQELLDLGAENLKIGRRAVEFRGDLELLYKANLNLRTCINILRPIKKFKAINDKQLYRKVSEIDWRKYLNARQTFSIDSIVYSKFFTHSQYVALKMKDAIVDQFRNRFNERPTVDTKFPDIKFNLHISEDEISISVDTSGQNLGRRGYRLELHNAPLSEILAAGMLMLTGWDKKTTLIDPMCGTGTIPIEAAMMAHNIPPNLNRKHFGFFNLPDYDPELFEKCKKELEANITTEGPLIMGSDSAPNAVEMSINNATRAGVESYIKFRKIDIKELKPISETGMLIMNPPYGERMQTRDIDVLYSNIGNQLKHEFRNHTAWILSGRIEGLKSVGLKTSRRLDILNGKIECKFVKYELYEGSKKHKSAKVDVPKV